MAPVLAAGGEPFLREATPFAMSMQSVTSKQRLVHAGQLESPA